MHGLELTYEVLAESKNEAAIDVMVQVFKDPEPKTRRLAIRALLQREEPRAARAVLQRWDLLQTDDLNHLRPRKRWILGAVKQALASESEMSRNGVAAAKSLGIDECLPQLI
ncbi:MAG: HEAT repeat domain-containing protein, partial [Planctomycetota bacterium]